MTFGLIGSFVGHRSESLVPTKQSTHGQPLVRLASRCHCLSGHRKCISSRCLWILSLPVVTESVDDMVMVDLFLGPYS